MPRVSVDDRVLRRRRTIAVTASVVVVLAVVAVGWWIWITRQPQLTQKQLSDKTNSLQFEGKYEDAIKLNIQMYEASNNKTERYALALGIGNLYEHQKQWQEAIDWYTKAQKESGREKDKGVASGLGRCYEALGNKALAAKNYQIALDLVDHNKIGWEADEYTYKTSVERMSK